MALIVGGYTPRGDEQTADGVRSRSPETAPDIACETRWDELFLNSEQGILNDG